jgi:hypothetical protein
MTSFGGPGVISVKFTMSEWAKKPEIKRAWKEIAEKYDLAPKEFDDPERIFSFLDAALSWSQKIHFSMSKARRLGFHGFVDSSECILDDVFPDFARLKMIPPVPKP